MKNKGMIGLQSRNLLLIFGMSTVALLVSTSSQMQMVSASVEEGTPGPNTSNSNQGTGSVAQCTDSNPHDPPICGQENQPNNADVSCEEDPYKCVGQSQGNSQGVAPGSNTSNSNQGSAEGPNPCISDPNRCKPTNNAEQSQGNQSAAEGSSPFGPHIITNAEQSQGNQSAAEGCSPMDPRCNTDVNCAVNPGDPACHGAAPASSSSGDSSNPNQEAVNHINQAQSALQNGDTAGAQQHMDLAKKSLGCNKIIDPNC